MESTGINWRRKMCDHKMGIWQAVSKHGDQYYELSCGSCGEKLGPESHIPHSPHKPFTFCLHNALIYGDQHDTNKY